MITYWQASAVLLLLLGAQQTSAGLFEAFLPGTSHRGLNDEAVLDAIANNKDLWTAVGGGGKLPLAKGKKVVPLLKTYFSGGKKSASVTKNGQKHSSLALLSSMLKGVDQKKLVKSVLKRADFVKKYPKSIMKREVLPPIDRRQIVQHCSDLQSYYFPALDECYRVFQIPPDNMDPNYGGERNELAYGTSQYDYMYNCWELYHGKLLDIGSTAIREKMHLVKQMVLQFYQATGQRGAIRVGFMISKSYELMAQNGTFYDVLDGVYVKMHPTKPCDDVCCIIMTSVGKDTVEMEQASCDNADVPNFFCQRQGND